MPTAPKAPPLLAATATQPLRRAAPVRGAVEAEGRPMTGEAAPGAAFGRRLVRVLLVVLLPLLAAGWASHVLDARDALGAQIGQRNRDAATLLAAVLAAARRDAAAEEAAAASEFARLPMRRLGLVAPEGHERLELTRPDEAEDVPAWFLGWISTPMAPAVARVGEGAVQVRVEMQAAPGIRSLWHGALTLAAVLIAAAMLAPLVVGWALARWRRALELVVEQAQAIAQGRFVTAAEPPLPGLREMTRALNAITHRARERFDAQARQVAELQRRVQTDAVTGLAVREPFLARLDALLAGVQVPAAGLLLVRVQGLERLNRVHGREAADHLLAAVAAVLLTYVEQVPGACAGRLNGSDFALGLPATGLVRETAESVHAALAAAPALRLAGAGFALGGGDGLRGVAVGAALAAADAALAEAEADDGVAVVDFPEAAPGGARAWRGQIAQALAQGRVRIEERAVVDARSTLVHLERSLYLQLQPGGEYLDARRWRALAARSGLLPEADLAAVDLALRAIAADGRARCVHVALRIFADSGVAAALQARLEAHPEHAQRLAIEWTDGGRGLPAGAFAHTVAGWRRCGVTVGVRHAGVPAHSLAALETIGVDHLKVDAPHLRGLADDATVREYARSLVALIHGLGLRAFATGIDEPRELEVLQSIGFDGTSGTSGAAVPTPAA